MAALAALIAQLRGELPEERLLRAHAERISYSYDNSRREGLPDLVVLVEHASEVATVARLCCEHQVALTARGRGSNTTGASIASQGGVVLSFERMNTILELHPADRLAVVQPGVLNAELQAAAAEQGFFWAPDPTSAPYASIGGNLACNAGGPRAVKYGASRDHVLALRAVDGRGRGFRCGAAVSKNSSGFDLARLLVGSEGTLALITEATLRLTPLPATRRGMRALFADVASAGAAVARLMAQPAIPSALEFMDAGCLALLRQRGVAIDAGAGALLLIEADGSQEEVTAACRALQAAAVGPGLLDWQTAADAEGQEQLWSARRALSPALRSVAPDKINEDVVVPVSRIPALVAGVAELARRFELPVLCFGHAGNGNLHVNILYHRSEGDQASRAAACLESVFTLVLELGGMPSGEHGIGIAKRELLGRALDPLTLELMRGIKSVFDPRGILNPGKLLP